MAECEVGAITCCVSVCMDAERDGPTDYAVLEKVSTIACLSASECLRVADTVTALFDGGDVPVCVLAAVEFGAA